MAPCHAFGKRASSASPAVVSVAGSYLCATPLMRESANPILSKIRHKGFRHVHGAILPLVILKNRNHGPPNSQPAPVERVHELQLVPLPIPDVHPARLEVRAVRA